VESRGASSRFDASLAFRVDRLATGRALLAVAEHHSALVAASVGDEPAEATGAAPGSMGGCSAREVLERAKRRGIVLQLHEEDGTALVAYRGQRPVGRVDRP